MPGPCSSPPPSSALRRRARSQTRPRRPAPRHPRARRSPSARPRLRRPHRPAPRRPTDRTGSSDPSATTTPSATPTPTGSVPPPSASPTTDAPDTRLLRGAPPALLAAAAADAVPQSAHAADFIARTLAAGDDHYVYPGSTFFDGGNTIDAVLALDGAGAGSDQADAGLGLPRGRHRRLHRHGLRLRSYAGPTAKALLAVGVHGADPSSFGGLDLVAELQSTEGAVERVASPTFPSTAASPSATTPTPSASHSRSSRSSGPARR